MSALDSTVDSPAPEAQDAGEAPAAPATRSLSGEKAQRIIDAMRSSVARRGTAGSTFDHVSREAGVSRGLLHYYFGTKEQLLVEAVRRDCELRLQRLERQLEAARSADDYLGLMVQSLQENLREDPDFMTLLFELFTLSRRNADIAKEYKGLLRRTREQLAGMLAAADAEGILHLHAEPEAVADILFAVGDGLVLRMLAEPERDLTATLHASMTCAHALLSD